MFENSLMHGYNKRSMKVHKQVEEYLGKKLIEKNYELGCRILYIPILAKVFPYLFGKKMQKVSHYFFVINGTKRRVDRSLFNKVHEGEMLAFNYNDKDELVSISSLSKF